MKRITTLAAVVALSFGLTGCGAIDGTVTGKVHRDAYTTTYPLKVGKVTTIQTQHHPECWEVTVSGANSGSECVDKATYDTLSVGDHYTSAS